LLDLRRSLGRILPGLKTYVVAWRSLRRFRGPRYRPLRSLWTPPPPLLSDRATGETTSINLKSAEYYEREGMREFWLNRPFSSPETVGKYLERFGLLLSMLRIQPEDRVLDFGCGTGWSSIMLARMGAEVLGLDVAPSALEIAREAAGRELTPAQRARLSFRTFDGGTIDVEDGEMDFVLVFDAFHHFPNPMGILAEFSRVLSSHGRFGFAEPGAGHAEAEHSLAESAHGILEEDLDLEQLFRSACAAGFEELDLAIPALEPEILTLPMARMRSFLRGRSWLVPQDFLRKTVLTGPIGVFRKDSYPATSLNPRALDARIEPGARRVRATAGELFRVAARVTNTGETAWLREGRRGRGQVQLGAHLLSVGGALLVSDYGRAGIGRDLQLRDVAELELELTAPQDPGSYVIRLDMVNEGICWFAQRGSAVSDVALEVGSA
jgi:SAM-dependent methyltransferase